MKQNSIKVILPDFVSYSHSKYETKSLSRFVFKGKLLHIKVYWSTRQWVNRVVIFILGVQFSVVEAFKRIGMF